MNRNKKLANMAMLVALAMIFSYVESLIPINFGVPGMKLGVANLVTVTGLYFLEAVEESEETTDKQKKKIKQF